MTWLYWAVKRHLQHKKRIGAAMAEMRRNNYVADFHDLLPGNKRRNWAAY